MPNVIEGTIEINDSSVYYQIHGDGLPILMIAGWGMGFQLMSGCMEEPVCSINYPFKRIYLDLPGMGRSTPGSVKNSDDMLEILFAFIDHFIPDNGTFLLAGESYGGCLAQGLIHKMPERVLGVLYICPHLVVGEEKNGLPVMEVLEKDESFLKTLSNEEKEAFEYYGVVQNESVWNRYKEQIYEVLKMQNSFFLENVLDGAFSYDITLKTPFEKPALIITGKQDFAVGYKNQFSALDSYPRGTYVALDKGGHNAQIEQAELFTCLVKEWLRRVLFELEL